VKIPSIKEIHRLSRTKRWGYEHVLDYWANVVVKIALMLRISPIQITVFWVVFQFFSTFMFMLGTYGYNVLALILFQFMFIVDLSDGKMYRFYTSRRHERKPLFPKYIDRLGHFVNNALLFMFLGIGSYFRFGEAIYLYLGLTISIVYLMGKAISVNSSWYKSDEERTAVTNIFNASAPRATKSKVRQFFFDFFRVEHIGNLLFFGIIFDQVFAVLVIYLMAFSLELLRKLLAQAKLLMQEDRKD
jgi:hypothetical protein